jgi:hypothetical protein
MGNWYKVTRRINGRFYHYWQDVSDITLLKKGDPNARPHKSGMTFKELTEQEAAALFNDSTFSHDTKVALDQLGKCTDLPSV